MLLFFYIYSIKISDFAFQTFTYPESLLDLELFLRVTGLQYRTANFHGKQSTVLTLKNTDLNQIAREVKLGLTLRVIHVDLDYFQGLPFTPYATLAFQILPDIT